MTRTARALVTGPLVLLLALSAIAAAAAPDESLRDGAASSELRLPATPGASPMTMWLPSLTEILGPLVLAAVCGAALALFSAGPRQPARVRVKRRP
jgi:hypothetical protein